MELVLLYAGALAVVSSGAWHGAEWQHGNSLEENKEGAWCRAMHDFIKHCFIKGKIV